MQWDASSPAAGFSSVEPWEPLAEDWPTVNVAAEDADPGSLRARYRELIELRAAHRALQTGETFVVETGSSAVYAVLRVASGDAILTIINLSDAPVAAYGLSLVASPLCGDVAATVLLGPEPSVGSGTLVPPALTGTGGFADWRPVPELPPRGSLILELGAALR